MNLPQSRSDDVSRPVVAGKPAPSLGSNSVVPTAPPVGAQATGPVDGDGGEGSGNVPPVSIRLPRVCYCGFPLEPHETKCPQCTKQVRAPVVELSHDDLGNSLLAIVQSAVENAQLIAAEMGSDLSEIVLNTQIGRAEVLAMQLRAVRRLVNAIGAVGEQASEIGSGADANGMAGRSSTPKETI